MRFRDPGYSYDDVLLAPQEGVLEKREYADISSDLIKDLIRPAIPIISAPMTSVTEEAMARAMKNLGGYGILHRFAPMERRLEMISNVSSLEFSMTGTAIGIHDTKYDIQNLSRQGAKIFCLDVAHAHHKTIGKYIEDLKSWTHKPLIVGNVATAEGARFLVDLGVDCVKVGIGPGAACTTRTVTGFGVPQLTAIMDVYEEIKGEATIIADGGIKNSGDIVKALAAGADTVMVGSLLAGCDEAPMPGKYLGMASKAVNGHHAPEGVEGVVAKTGPVEGVIKQLAWGIRSGISYGGATNIEELREKAEFIPVGYGAHIETATRI